MNVSRRVSAVLVALALAMGNGAVCAGWAPSREARMACCSDDCPMHKSHSHERGSSNGVTQADADACCAASEPDSAAPTPAPAAASVAPAIVQSPVPFLPAGLVTVPLAWRTPVPLPAAHVSKHLLLSVLLV